jgi:transcription termination factor Rho
MSVLDRAALEDSTLADLHAIAAELGIEGYRRLRKGDLIDALLTHQGADLGERSEAVESAHPGERADDEGDDDGDETGAASSRRRRGRRGGRGRGAAGRPAEGQADEPAEPEAVSASASDETGESSSRPGRRSRGGRRARGEESNGSGDERRGDHAREQEPEAEIVEGVVELLANGSGFLRLSAPEASDKDVYISAAQVKRCELVSGDRVSGPRRAPHRSERYPSLVRIDTVNGRPAGELADRTRFEDLPSGFPTERFKLGSTDDTLKAIEFLTPFGSGSRVVISGGRWAGKSRTLLALAQALSEIKELTVSAALAGVRPEEVAEWNAGPVVPGAAVTFAASAEAQDNAVELVIDQARRLAARGEHAVVLVDTLDGLHQLSARRVLASARKIVDGGSLTVIATSSEPVGGETTVIALDAALAASGRYPALDLSSSGTLRPDLLVGEAGAKAISKERAKALPR